ncbi:GNAT family N-acetyltransferase [Changchengzhania lutea]|uniref:GNAT family N-acetyltransferase n=1 Tax=Changchengzhania lutea TaxID=2049305 RepID=UPI00115E0024|nr:GNAT family N-acetyltransferase [Changchengzhania lutea]
MDFKIRNARQEDMPQVLQLIKELAVFEKEPDAVEVTIKDLQQDGFGDHPRFHCFVAEVAGNIEGIALVYNRYSTWKGKAVHLEDLIVSENMRGSGLGKALLDEVIKYANNLGVKRVNWEVLDWNEPAIKFYEKNGARVLRDWNVVQLNEAGIKQYISKL